MKTTNFYCIVEFCSYYLVIRSFTRFYFVSKSHITSVVRLWQFYLLPGSEKKRENVQMEVNTHSAWELMWNILYVQKMHRFSLPRREYELTWRTSGGFSLTVVALLCDHFFYHSGAAEDQSPCSQNWREKQAVVSTCFTFYGSFWKLRFECVCMCGLRTKAGRKKN